MDILVIDRDALTNQLLASKLGARGHKVMAEPNKNMAFDMISNGHFDCVIADPAPLSEARPVVVGIWKNVRTPVKPYIVLLSKTATAEEAILSGANDVLGKPLSAQDLDLKMRNAERLLGITRQLAREDDVHSTGGMVGKAAFKQLFLSSIDRAFRYGERSLIIFVHIGNYDDIVKTQGQAAADEMMKKLTEKMTFMRRQSDVIGRLSVGDFAILLQRPQFEAEPLDALNRFAETLNKFHFGFENAAAAPRLSLSLVEVPQGAEHASRLVPSPPDITEGQA